MSFKSILDIDVNSEKFVEFQKKFAQYQQSLKDNPKLWKSSEKAMAGAASQFQSIAELSAALALHIHDAAKDQDHFRKATDKTDLSMQKLARTTATVTKNILSSTMALLKWSGVATAIGGLLGAGGLFGIDRLASSVAGTRKEAAGIGVSSGQLGAFGLDFRRYLNDPTGFLSKISDLKSSYKGAATFAGMGISDYQTKNPAELAIEVLQKAQQKWQTTPTNQRKEEFFRAFGFMDTMSLDEMRRLGGAKDLNRQTAQYRSDVGRFAMPAGYQGVSDQLSRAGMGIEAVMARALVPLQRPIMQLSGAIERAIESLSKSGTIKDWINDLGKGIKNLAEYLNSPEFSADIADFMDALSQLTQGIKQALNMLPGVHIGPTAASTYRRMGAMFGISPGVFTQVEKDITPAGFKGTQETVQANASMLASFMTHHASREIVQAFVEKMIVGEDRVKGLRGPLNAPGAWNAQERANVSAAVSRVMVDLHVSAPAGSDVSKNVALTVAQ